MERPNKFIHLCRGLTNDNVDDNFEFSTCKDPINRQGNNNN